jgi:predicted negative regulator of RcsB-dependent stress response
VDRVHRRDLKHDKFVQQVGHSVEYASEHRQQVFKYGAIGLAAIVVVVVGYMYFDHQQAVRAEALQQALRIQQGAIGDAPNEYVATFKTQAEKDAAAAKAFSDVGAKYSGSKEADIAHFYLGSMSVEQGKIREAEKEWKLVMDSGHKEYASQAKFSLAQLYATENRTTEAEKLLRDLMANPTIMVSKEQATIELAHVLAKTRPDEARKLLDPLKTSRSAISRTAITALSEIPAKQ